MVYDNTWYKITWKNQNNNNTQMEYQLIHKPKLNLNYYDKATVRAYSSSLLHAIIACNYKVRINFSELQHEKPWEKNLLVLVSREGQQ